jgi:hypothetical protein
MAELKAAVLGAHVIIIVSTGTYYGVRVDFRYSALKGRRAAR